MKKHIEYAIRTLQETYLDFSAFQEDVELLIDVAKGKLNHLLEDNSCLNEEVNPASSKRCRVCQAISRLESGA